MRTSRIVGVLLLAAGLVLLTVALSAQAASNAVPMSRADDDTDMVDPNELAPPECAALNLTNLVVGSGELNGTAAGDLIVGGAGTDEVVAGDGDDCVVVGSGDQQEVDGGPGVDVCISDGDAEPEFDNCETQIAR